jgi:capsule polysaccharide export protein KpsC/LpsZ
VIATQWLSGGSFCCAGESRWKQRLRTNEARPRVFIPLQFVPEATVDYWCRNVEVINYSRILMKAVRVFADKGYVTLVKEHPGIVGMRDNRLCKALLGEDNVIMVPPQIRATYLSTICDCVLVWTGTVGFEAALRGRQVLHFGSPYYVSGNWFWSVDSIRDLPRVLDELTCSRNLAISRDEQLDMVAHVLAGCIPGNLLYRDCKWKKSEKYGYLAEVKEAAQSIAKVSRRLGT